MELCIYMLVFFPWQCCRHFCSQIFLSKSLIGEWGPNADAISVSWFDMFSDPPFDSFLSHHYYYYYYLICNAQILLGMWCKTDYFSHYAMFSFASFWVWNWNCKNLFGVYEIWWVGFFMSDSFVCFVHITHKSKVVMYVKAVNTLEESSFDPKILNPSFVNYCK